MNGIESLFIKVTLLKDSIKEKKREIQHPEVHALFTRTIRECEFQLNQIPFVRAEQKTLRSHIEKKIEAIKKKLLIPENYTTTPWDLAAKFRQHKTLEAFQEFAHLEKQVCNRVFEELWKLKGSPVYHYDYGKLAFHGFGGYPCSDLERAEALVAVERGLDIEEQLSPIMDCFLEKEIDRRQEAYALFEEFEKIHPDLALRFFFILSLQASSGRNFFYGKCHEYDPKKIVEAIKETMKLPCNAATEDQLRHECRIEQVITENQEIIKKGFYTTPAGKKQEIKEAVEFSKRNSVSFQATPNEKKKAKFFTKLHIEGRAQSSVAAAYALQNPLLLNFFNEKELSCCTTLSGTANSVYTPQIVLFRMGPERDYEFYQEPAILAVAKVDFSKKRDGVHTFLKMAYEQGHDSLVLNVPVDLAELFLEVVQNQFPSCFKEIVFVAQKDFSPISSFIHRHLGDVYDENGTLLCK